MKLNRNDPCWCGSGKKFKKCHGRAGGRSLPIFKKPTGTQILTQDELPKMRESCKFAANILKTVAARVEPGLSTEQINTWVHEMIVERNAYPSPLNYPKTPVDLNNPIITPGGFPKSVCTSINEIVCHGIPDESDILQDGDIVNIDVTVNLDGYHGDTSKTVYVGSVSQEARKLTETAKKCLDLGIEAVKPGGRLIAVGHAIYNHATQLDYGVVREYTGHGIGRTFHTEPQVCHYPSNETDCDLIPGMIFTIEPMINCGTWKTEVDPRDGWTVYTMDRKLSAQFEHTILVTETGAEILTIPD